MLLYLLNGIFLKSRAWPFHYCPRWLSAYSYRLAIRRRGVGNDEALGGAFGFWMEAEILNPELLPWSPEEQKLLYTFPSHSSLFPNKTLLTFAECFVSRTLFLCRLIGAWDLNRGPGIRVNASLQIVENKCLNMKINLKTCKPRMQMISASSSLWEVLFNSTNLGIWT